MTRSGGPPPVVQQGPQMDNRWRCRRKVARIGITKVSRPPTIFTKAQARKRRGLGRSCGGSEPSAARLLARRLRHTEKRIVEHDPEIRRGLDPRSTLTTKRWWSSRRPARQILRVSFRHPLGPMTETNFECGGDGQVNRLAGRDHDPAETVVVGM